MHEDLETFVSVGFSADGVGHMTDLREGLALRSPDDLAVLKDGFRELVEQRSLSLREWAAMSDLDFDSEDELYSYLLGAYDYLFKGAETPPEPPL